MVIPQHQILSNLISIRTIILYDTFINLQIINQNQCIDEMDTVKGFTIVPTHYDIIIC